MPGSDWRAPALSVLAGGAELGGVIGARVLAGSAFSADRFSVRAALAAVDPALLAGGDIPVVVRIGLDGGWATVIEGEADAIDIDPIAGTLLLEGRDLAARLIEARTQDAFQNQTSSEIAATLAARRGLAARVTATTTPVGRYYQIEHDRITLNQFSRATTEWDLLVYLARQEGFDLYAEGGTLHFEAPGAGAAAPVVLTPGDVTELRLHRALSFARDIAVTVKSWNSRQQNAFTQTARASPGAGRSGRAQSYVLVRPNLSPDDALTLAQRTLAELSSHERVVWLSMPGELALTPRTTVALAGTGTDFDQLYAVAELERTIDARRGFTQRLRLKNAPADSQSTVSARRAVP